MNKKIGIIIFARSSSNRFPNKIFQKILNLKMIEIVINRVKKIQFEKKKYEIIVNTSSYKNDDKIVNFCKKNNIKFYRGSLLNVFKRTHDCLKKHNYEIFVRVNCDRPFLDYIMISKMINLIKKNKKVDIISNCLGYYPKGLACEVARSKVFFENFHRIKNKQDKEHIFNFFYRNLNEFKILNISDPVYKKNHYLNLSVDYKKDLKMVSKIFKFFKNNYLINTKKVLTNFHKIKLERCY